MGMSERESISMGSDIIVAEKGSCLACLRLMVADVVGGIETRGARDSL